MVRSLDRLLLLRSQLLCAVRNGAVDFRGEDGTTELKK